jgi:hypothetical protein
LPSIIVAVTASIIIAIAWAIVEAPPRVVIGWPAAINKNGPVHVIIARRSPINSDVQGRSRNGRRANHDFSPPG